MSKPSLTLGTTLYHGTLSKLPNGFPNSKDGNWFATDATQSILHALASHKARQTHTPYLYIYKLINVPKITKFRDRNNLNAFASTLGFNTNYGSMAFTNANANMMGGGSHQTRHRLCYAIQPNFSNLSRFLKLTYRPKGTQKFGLIPRHCFLDGSRRMRTSLVQCPSD